MGEFVILGRVRHIAAGGPRIMDFKAIGQAGGDMPAIGAAAPVMVRRRGQWLPCESGDAVVAFEAAQGDMGIAGVGQRRDRYLMVLGLDFLETENIGRDSVEQAQNLVQTQP